MNESQKMLKAFRSGRLLRPSVRKPNLVGLANAFGLIFGSPIAKRTAGAAHLVQRLGRPTRIVFVLVDGLGADVVKALPKASFMRSHLRTELLTVFPAATTAALNALATGAWPAEHGVTNWFLHLDELKAQVRPLPHDERFSGTPLGKLGLKPGRLFRLPSLFPSFRCKVTAVMPEAIASSVFTSYTSGVPHSLGYGTFKQACRIVGRVIGKSDAPQFVYLYFPTLDATSHQWGKWHPRAQALVRALDSELDALRKRMPADVKIVVSADHGFRDIGPGRYFTLSTRKELTGMLRFFPTGDSRMTLFHVKKGCKKGFKAEFLKAFGRHYALLTPAELGGLKLLGPGPISALVRRRLGDYVAVALDDSVLKLESKEHDAATHSGLSPEEMRIPLIIG